VVFGIIVDQFAELRDQRKEQANDKASICPICGCDISDDSDGDHRAAHVRTPRDCIDSMFIVSLMLT